MPKDFKITIDSCPVCGSKERLFEQLGKELIERGLAREKWTQCYDVKEGVVFDATKSAKYLVGTKLPTYYIRTDICMGSEDKPCGCIYATVITISESTVNPTPAENASPNRAQRRRKDRDGGFGLPLFGQG